MKLVFIYKKGFLKPRKENFGIEHAKTNQNGKIMNSLF